MPDEKHENNLRANELNVKQNRDVGMSACPVEYA